MFLSERRDSNPRPLAPQASALPGCATLRTYLDCPPKLLSDLSGAEAGQILLLNELHHKDKQLTAIFKQRDH